MVFLGGGGRKDFEEKINNFLDFWNFFFFLKKGKWKKNIFETFAHFLFEKGRIHLKGKYFWKF